jgi:hypothetical protein
LKALLAWTFFGAANEAAFAVMAAKNGSPARVPCATADASLAAGGLFGE